MYNLVPLGSVVLLKGGSQKLLIIARAIHVKNGEETFYFDYGAVLYPDGLTGDQMAYFNHDNISKIVFEGYADIENENVVENINRYLLENPDINRGDPAKWKYE